MRRISCILVMLPLFLLSTGAKDKPLSFDEQSAWRLIKDMATDAMQGRRSGQPGAVMAGRDVPSHAGEDLETRHGKLHHNVVEAEIEEIGKTQARQLFEAHGVSAFLRKGRGKVAASRHLRHQVLSSSSVSSGKKSRSTASACASTISFENGSSPVTSSNSGATE